MENSEGTVMGKGFAQAVRPLPPDARLQRLAARLRGLPGRVFIAYSGGLDSRFLAYAACRAGCAPTLLHVSGPHVPGRESGLAVARAGRMGLPVRVLFSNPLDLPEVRANGRERCYFCKRALFARLLAEARAAGGQAITLCDGSNRSDLQGYRPGLRALAELGIRSPLEEAGLKKADIRELAALSGMEAPDQPSRPCLLTRFAYGVRPTPELLARVDAAEQAVEESWLAVEAARGAASSAAPPPDFRIRLAGADLVLQMDLPPDREAPFMAVLAARLEALRLPVPLLAAGEAVSGYFDRRA